MARAYAGLSICRHGSGQWLTLVDTTIPHAVGQTQISPAHRYPEASRCLQAINPPFDSIPPETPYPEHGGGSWEYQGKERREDFLSKVRLDITICNCKQGQRTRRRGTWRPACHDEIPRGPAPLRLHVAMPVHFHTFALTIARLYSLLLAAAD